MARGKNIQMFLMDGDANGRIKCTLNNWTGVVYKIPRTLLMECDGRDDLKHTGVYLLLGMDDTDDKPIVYVGQARSRKNGEALFLRLAEHNKRIEKDFFTEAVVITTSNNSLGPTEVSYMENYFYNRAVEVGRCIVRNGNDPNPGNITEEKECKMQDFVESAELLIGTLGYKIFVPLDDKKEKSREEGDTDLLYLRRTIKRLGLTLDARGKLTAEGFIVLKGSLIAPEGSENNISSGISKRRRNAAIKDNILQEDLLFGSPSSAASFVIGNSANGWTEWKAKDGRNLHQLEGNG